MWGGEEGDLGGRGTGAVLGSELGIIEVKNEIGEEEEEGRREMTVGDRSVRGERGKRSGEKAEK